MTAVSLAPTTRFTLPPDAEATEPPEHRGLARDGIRLLVARPSSIEHTRFRDLTDYIGPGDVVVVNTSATLPAAIDGTRSDGTHVPVHVSTQLDDGDWVVELRRSDGHGPDLGVNPGDVVTLPGGTRLRLVWPYPDPDALRSRLWRATVTPDIDVVEHLTRFGRPIQYGYVDQRFPLADYQTVYANEPGSAEMASAGRPFTAELLVRLLAAGVSVMPIVLHTGVSSPELHEPPTPERFAVPAATAEQVTAAHAAGRQVVAVGTTVTRALETAATADGIVSAAEGWTDLVLGPDRPARVVDGLISGLHPPEASHLLLLEAVAGAELVGSAYNAAVSQRYLWHEFGDSMLFLP
ncbi:S-adenosylmethionine:tRNA ribosyltransferase-isomerase [Haloechinothrix halophila]|uniref:S-adenosylmethionine:tRNA ribosyltransferase-isomerase n=1 Tax=Haloechinothrix halophila TaxID=1069073 RepID=UPI0004175D4A|nr:S-adenosylmethionine:tRNA ribosyltransferase-isomerase [Haloechinothrix halophila]